MKHPYEDILHLSRPASRRQKCSMQDRAAQFSPFAALSGYDEAIRETARWTEEERSLSMDGTELLDEALRQLSRREGERPWVLVEYFEPDERKQGGLCREKTAELAQVDGQRQRLVFSDGSWVDFSRILRLEPVPGP